MDYITLAATIDQAQPSLQVDAQTLYRAFEQVADGRKKTRSALPLSAGVNPDRLSQIGGRNQLERSD